MTDIVTNFDLSGKNVLIQAQNNPFYGKKIGFIGDSFTYGATLNNIRSERYSKILCDMLGAEEHNVAVSGTGFVSTTNYPTNFSKQADNLKQDCPNCDVVIVLGGVNDCSRGVSVTEICQAQDDLFIKLNQLFPNSKLCWAGLNYPPTTSSWLDTVSVSANRVNGYPYYTYPTIAFTTLDNPTDRIKYNGNAYYSTDKVHPNSNGHKLMAVALCNSLLGGKLNNFVWQHASFEDGVSGGLTATADNNIWHVYGQLRVTKKFVSGWNKVATMQVPLGNIVEARAACSWVASSVYHVASAEVRKDGTVWIQHEAEVSSGTRYYAFQITAYPYFTFK